MTKHWSEQYSCHVCGKRHRNYMEDAKHRHNFPLLCKSKKLTAKEAKVIHKAMDEVEKQLEKI